MMRFICNICLYCAVSVCLLPPAYLYAGNETVSNANGTSVDKTGKQSVAYLELLGGRDMENAVVDDFNKDGNLDIAAVSHGENCLKIFFGKGNRKFEQVQVLPKKSVGFHPDHVASVDWDGDGFDDLLLASEGERAVLYFRNNKGRFSEKPMKFSVSAHPQSLLIADLDQDGKRDIVLGPYGPQNITVLWGKDPKAFSFEVTKISRSPEYGGYISLGDWNKDGRQDVFFIEPDSNRVRVAINKGKRRFVNKDVYAWVRKNANTLPRMPASVASADLNGDGCVDVLIPMELGKVAVIAYGDCHGNTASVDEIPAPAWGYRGCGAVAAGKGHPAMIALGEKQKMFIGKQDKDGKWKLKKFKAGKSSTMFKFLDIDKDGNLDVLFVDYDGDKIGIYFGPLF